MWDILNTSFSFFSSNWNYIIVLGEKKRENVAEEIFEIMGVGGENETKEKLMPKKHTNIHSLLSFLYLRLSLFLSTHSKKHTFKN